MHISTRNKLKYFGLKRFCPVCRSWLRYFRPHGNKPRLDALCPVCHSLERHRLVWLFFKDKTNLFEAPLKMLHAAPENCFIRRLRNRENIDYTSIDIESNLADKNMDLTCLDFENETFDVFYCSHVLEHIPDDKKALAEIHRVLKKDGWAVFMVPMSGQTTQEDPHLTDPAEREKRFGNINHYRIYGTDFVEKLQQHGFQAQTAHHYTQFSKFKTTFWGLLNEPIFYCKK